MLAAIAGFLLVFSYSERWPRLSRPDRMTGIGFVLLLLTAATAAIEQMIREVPVGIRTGFSTAALGWLIAGLASLYRREHID